jgi:hypothetical protein
MVWVLAREQRLSYEGEPLIDILLPGKQDQENRDKSEWHQGKPEKDSTVSQNQIV